MGGNGDTGAGAGLGDLLHRHDVFQGAHTHTAELLGDRNAQKADLAHLGDQLEGEALLLVQLGDGTQLLVNELPEHGLHELLLVVPFKFHGKTLLYE